MKNRFRNSLILLFILITFCGLILHLRFHPPIIQNAFELTHTIPIIFGLISMVFIPLLFLSKETSDIAYLLAGLTVILGIIMMTHLSIATWQGEVLSLKIFLNTTFSYSLLLFSKFLIAKLIFENYYPERVKYNFRFPQTFRFLFPGWWVIHFIGISTIYFLGVVLR
jgi:hypothetical protein